MASPRGIEWLLDQVAAGVPAEETYAQRESYAQKKLRRLEKGDNAVKRVGEALTGYRKGVVEVVSFRSTKRGSPQDRTNKADAQIVMRIRGHKDQHVNIQVKSSAGGMVEFLRLRYGDPREELAWEKMASEDLILLNGQDDIETIRRNFLIQLGIVMSYRTGAIWQLTRDGLEAIVAKLGVANTQAG